jgi:hypothetical protein
LSLLICLSLRNFRLFEARPWSRLNLVCVFPVTASGQPTVRVASIEPTGALPALDTHATCAHEYILPLPKAHQIRQLGCINVFGRMILVRIGGKPPLDMEAI